MSKSKTTAARRVRQHPRARHQEESPMHIHPSEGR